MTRSLRKRVLQFAVALAALAIVPACLRAYQITGISDAPTLVIGDKLLMNRAAYVFTAPHRGDLLVLRFPDRPGFGPKRVIGIPGDTVQMADDRVIVNGRTLAMHALDRADFNWVSPVHRIGSTVAIEEGHLIAFTPGLQYNTLAPVKLASGEYFVLGDNRDMSADSRVWGPVHADRFIGKTIVSTLDLAPARRAELTR
jgi:signal peptidase I